MSEQIRIEFETWRDNSMGRNTLRIRPKFMGFGFAHSKAVSDEAIGLAGKIADCLERDLKDFNDL